MENKGLKVKNQKLRIEKIILALFLFGKMIFVYKTCFLTFKPYFIPASGRVWRSLIMFKYCRSVVAADSFARSSVVCERYFCNVYVGHGYRVEPHFVTALEWRVKLAHAAARSFA